MNLDLRMKAKFQVFELITLALNENKLCLITEENWGSFPSRNESILRRDFLSANSMLSLLYALLH